MNFRKSIFLLFFILTCVCLRAQKTDSDNINNLFIEYLNKNLDLKPSEAVRMRPLIKKYLSERKNIVRNNKDPLERERQIIDLKIKYRKQFAPAIGDTKANSFFLHEQAFRRKVKEELRQRRKQKS